jgi:hypothetical protein
MHTALAKKVFIEQHALLFGCVIIHGDLYEYDYIICKAGFGGGTKSCRFLQTRPTLGAPKIELDARDR